MPWIQNVSLRNIRQGHHIEPGPNAMLIQIVDPGTEFPEPARQFRETHQFVFLDLEKDAMANDGHGNWVDMSQHLIQDQDAEQLVALLQRALEQRMNVIVHCHAGVCRSGAVAEVGVMMGFDDAESFRSPNLLVKHKMMKVLGWTYDDNEPHTINGVAVDPDWESHEQKVAVLRQARRRDQ